MQVLNNNIRIRRDYSKVKSAEDIPDLIKMQKDSYHQFLQLGASQDQRNDKGLENVLKAIFPIHSNDGRYILEYISYSLDKPKFSVEDNKQRGTTYAAALKIRLRLICNEVDKETGSVQTIDVQESDVYVADLPIMTKEGTFVINGTDRIIVSQIYRSPGVFFDHDKGKTVLNKYLYSASIIPHLGSWLDFEFDAKDLINVRIDKRKKISLMALLKSLDSKEADEKRKQGIIPSDSENTGMTNEEILETFYNFLTVERKGSLYSVDFAPEFYKSRVLNFDLIDSKTSEVLIKADKIVTSGALRKLTKANIEKVDVIASEVIGKFLGKDIKSSSGEVLHPAGSLITEEILKDLEEKNISSFEILNINNIDVGPYILNTVLSSKFESRFAALNEIYAVIKSADSPNIEAAEELFFNLFFNKERYDLSDVGRVKINERFGTKTEENVLTKEDIINVIKHLLKIRDGSEKEDDIDHLGNRRIRSAGELVANEIRLAFVRMERTIQEKMTSASTDIKAADVINVKSVQAALRDFFGSSQLSQFMDQTNPLSEITHKRRLSALGPKGLARDRASFEVRDVHVTHYGRICPIETPEGPNIGLINSLAIFAKINKYGFLETPYRKVVNGVVTDEVVYMNAIQDEKHVIAQATSPIDENNNFKDALISCRYHGELMLFPPEEVTYMDVSPKQLVSVAAALVPFLENDDANRALMGANMQRQAVPLLKTEAPLVGTGIEGVVARDSGAVVLAKRDGIVTKVDASRIIIKAVGEDSATEHGVDIYQLKKFQRSNHNTCINQKPIIRQGDKVKAGTIIADGHSIDKGELSLGKNVLVAFMPWNGYNFEDSILVSEKVVKDDVFTSVHIEEFEVVIRDTKLGAEEISADIPNVSAEALHNLDESGIVYTGAEVKSGDILVGKVTPKAETIATPEEKLLRAIFGEKAVDVKDTSLRLPAGISGTVIDVRVFSRRGIEKDIRSQIIEREMVDKYAKDRAEQKSLYASIYKERAANLLDGAEVSSSSNHTKGELLNKENLESLSVQDVLKIVVKNKETMQELTSLVSEYEEAVTEVEEQYEAKLALLNKGDDLPASALKVVKVFVAVKRKLQAGDKMAGRHGNKGVVSKILPVEDMPHLEDGTPVDICLNPLGVPSRMNVGQILEVHMGWASANVGKQINSMLEKYYRDATNVGDMRAYLESVYGENQHEEVKNLSDNDVLSLCHNIKKGLPVSTSVFDGVKEQDINNMLKFANVDTSGQMTLIDGRTGEFFDRKVTVGYIYMLKLHHLVDDKIHARSIGPYSLITQQPLGGKAQFGGQRFGEMEVWALEAYGAAYILREMLTVKSDDQVGRTHVYDSIIKGEETFETGIPESFNVLVKELRSLCLNLEMKKEDTN